MSKYVALLRGIAPMNPNMRNEKLRAVLEELGFTKVKTVISSGNVLFESRTADPAKLEVKIEAAWPEKLGFTSTTIVRSLDELKELAAAAPFAGYEHGPKTSLNVTFLKHMPAHPVTLEGQGFTIAATPPREICSIIDTTTSKTPDFMAKAEKAFGKQITTRTWKTVERIIKALEA
jgi:uncharacterized protein (DUF1697 family)